MKRSYSTQATQLVPAYYPVPPMKSRSFKRTKTTPLYRQPQFRGLTPSRSGFPKTLKMTHRYCEVFSLANTAGAIGTHVFSANGMFDPDITSTGHQPYYFDQLTGIYNHYTVIASKLRLTCMNASAIGNPSLVNVYLDDNAASSAALTTRLEQNTASTRLIEPGAAPVTIPKSFSAKANFGGNPLSDPNLQGTAAANPTEQMYYLITVADPSGTAAATTVDLLVEIDYIAVWQELATATAS